MASIAFISISIELKLLRRPSLWLRVPVPPDNPSRRDDRVERKVVWSHRYWLVDELWLEGEGDCG